MIKWSRGWRGREQGHEMSSVSELLGECPFQWGPLAERLQGGRAALEAWAHSKGRSPTSVRSWREKNLGCLRKGWAGWRERKAGILTSLCLTATWSRGWLSYSGHKSRPSREASQGLCSPESMPSLPWPLKREEQRPGALAAQERSYARRNSSEWLFSVEIQGVHSTYLTSPRVMRLLTAAKGNAKPCQVG